MPSRPGAKEVRLGSFRLAEPVITGPPPPTEIAIPIAASNKDGSIAAGNLTPAVWPPSDTLDVNTTNEQWSIFARKVRHVTFAFCEIITGHLIFDTSVIPDNAIISSAILRMVHQAKGTAEARALNFEWYDHGAAIDGADYVETPSPTAAAVPFATWSAYVAGTSYDIALSNPNANIVKTGETGIRMGMAGGAPPNDGGDYDTSVVFYPWDNTTYTEPQLVVTYTVPITYYGEVALPVAFSKAVAGTRKTFAQVAFPLTFAKDVKGSRVPEYLDNFNRADQVGLGTPSGGGVWTANPFGLGTPYDQMPDIVGNKAMRRAAVGAGLSFVYHSGLLAANCSVAAAVGGTEICALVLVTSNIGTNAATGYEIDLYRDTGNWILYRIPGDIVIGSGNITVPPDGSIFRLKLTATAVIVEYSTNEGDSWTSVASVNDTTHRSATTNPAFIVGGGDNPSTAWIDNLFVEGAASTSQIFRPIADIDAAGWTVEPLWSKIDEETADGTVITGVAS